MIKVSDYVFQFLADRGVQHVFMLPGGGCIHLCDSLGRHEEIEYIPLLHEQAVSVAAEAYGQHTNRPGVALVTSGPGATNAVTGVAAGWIDSTPMFILSGQAKTADLIGDRGVRQIGCQEVQIIPMISSITKYAVSVLDPNEIRYHLEKAWHLALDGRKGPVWIEIPLDIQGCMVEEAQLTGFTPKAAPAADISQEIRAFADLMRNSRKPLILAGNGIKLSGSEERFLAFARQLHIPVLTTWKAFDLFGHEDECYFGSPGLLGQRYANLILQSADLLLVLGSRLDYSLTAYNNGNFGKCAKKVLVDIDEKEIDKLDDMGISLKIVADVADFLDAVQKEYDALDQPKGYPEWLAYCRELKEKYPSVTEKDYAENGFVNTYAFVDKLSDAMKTGDILVPESSGNAGEVPYQAFRVKKGQKIKNAAGLGAMGFGLPYAIGACLANGGRRTILINGDGAFQLNIQELASLASMNLPVKIFIWDNAAYATIMATQRNLFEGNYVASEGESRLILPDILKIADAYGIKTFYISANSDLESTIDQVLGEDGPVICKVLVSPMQTVSPKVMSKRLPDGKMVSGLLEDMWPYVEGEHNAC